VQLTSAFNHHERGYNAAPECFISRKNLLFFQDEALVVKLSVVIAPAKIMLQFLYQKEYLDVARISN
jgi:hypothetical protein